MFIFKIIQTEVKVFMNKLLKEDTFNQFEVRGVEISTFTRFQITGVLDADFAADERRFCLWEELKPYVFNIIKGNKRPKSIKITLSLPAAQVNALHPNASALFLNITFSEDEILCTTATSEKNFTMDKTVDAAWDEYMKNFIALNGIISTQSD